LRAGFAFLPLNKQYRFNLNKNNILIMFTNSIKIHLHNHKFIVAIPQLKSMKLILLILSFCLFELTCFAQKPTIQWQKSYGGSFYDKAESIVETSDGGYVIAGHSESNDFDLSVNHGSFDFWIIKINNTGLIQWSSSWGGGNPDYLQQVIQTNDSGFLCIGNTVSNDGDITNSFGQIDFWVIKLNSLGTLQWKKNFGGASNDWGYSICLTNDSNYIIAGYSESNDQNVLNNHGNADFWVLKIDANGIELWQKSYGGDGFDYLTAIIQTHDGGYAMTGYSNSANGDFPQNIGATDIAVLKINSNGDIQWKNNFGGTLDDFGRAIMEDTEGNFIITGDTYSYDFDATENHNGYWSRDYIVIKTNNLGQKTWAKCYGGEGNEYGRSIHQTFDGEYAIAGESYSTTSGDPTGNHGSAEYWLIKIDPSNGNLRWEKNMGGIGHDEANCFIPTFDNGYIVVGNSAHPISDDVTYNYGDDDIWVVKLKNNECQKKLSLEKDIPIGSYEFKAIENITSQSKILSNTSNILYSTGKNIILNPGFKTESGAVFEAKIKGCY
jgi:hypothetical protein